MKSTAENWKLKVRVTTDKKTGATIVIEATRDWVVLQANEVLDALPWAILDAKTFTPLYGHSKL